MDEAQEFTFWNMIEYIGEDASSISSRMFRKLGVFRKKEYGQTFNELKCRIIQERSEKEKDKPYEYSIDEEAHYHILINGAEIILYEMQTSAAGVFMCERIDNDKLSLFDNCKYDFLMDLLKLANVYTPFRTHSKNKYVTKYFEDVGYENDNLIQTTDTVVKMRLF